MSNEKIRDYKDTKNLLANLFAQISSESFLDDVIGNPAGINSRLVNGPNHSAYFPNPIGDQKSATQSTDLMVTDFNEHWKVLFQLFNTSSGLSVTILQDRKDPGKLTFSFRSTESLPSSLGGDFERDGGDGADGEILADGFAFAQLLNMEEFYNQLVSGTGNFLEDISSASITTIQTILNNDAFKLGTTGYSLVSHLAQAFTLLHADKVDRTITFNGAGLGGLEGVSASVAD